MTYFLSLQFRRIQRWFKDQGVPFFIGILGFCLAFILCSLLLFSKVPYANWIYISIAFTLISNYQLASGKQSLILYFPKYQYYLINIIENCILQLPFFLYLIIKEQEFIPAIILLVVSALFGAVTFKISSSFKIPTPFKKRPFEYIIGFRKTIFFNLLAIFILVKALQVQNFQLGLFVLALIFLVGMSFYSLPENPYFVWIFKDKAKSFLWSKIKFAIINVTVHTLPFAIILGIGFPSKIVWIIITQIIGYLFITSMILAKYASYPDHIGIPQAILYGLSLWFPPFLIIVMILFYRRSISQLNEILQ